MHLDGASEHSVSNLALQLPGEYLAEFHKMTDRAPHPTGQAGRRQRTENPRGVVNGLTSGKDGNRPGKFLELPEVFEGQ